MHDCGDFGPFDVLWFPYEFPGDPDRLPKLFVVAVNVPAHRLLRCFKPTSQTLRFKKEPTLLKGVVEYCKGDLSCFDADRTIIESDTYGITYEHILRCHRDGKFDHKGSLPDDFRDRMVEAVKNRPDWRAIQKREFLAWFKPD